MSNPITKIVEDLRKAQVLLDKGEITQGKYRLNSEPNCYCAIGMLSLVNAIALDTAIRTRFYYGKNPVPKTTYSKIPLNVFSAIVWMNDYESKTPGDIADTLESIPLTDWK